MKLNLLENIKLDLSLKNILWIAVIIVFSIITVFIIVKPEVFLAYGYTGIVIFGFVGGQGAFILPFVIDRFNPLLLITLLSLGMTFNDTVSFFVGRTARNIILNKFDKKLEEFVLKYGFFGIFLISAIPLPISNGLISGLLRINTLKFFSATFIGKFVFLVIVYLFVIIL